MMDSLESNASCHVEIIYTYIYIVNQMSKRRIVSNQDHCEDLLSHFIQVLLVLYFYLPRY